MTAEKLMEAIRAVRPGRYDCTLADIVAIRDAGSGEALDTGADCFLYGFLKGQCFERAAAKKKNLERNRLETEKHAPGYGLIIAMAEKNKRNVRFVSVVSRFMLKMDRRLDEGGGQK